MKNDNTYDVFISYSRKDSKTAEKICTALSAAGIRYFIDREGSMSGDFPQALADAIDDSSVFLFLASRNSFNSKFTCGEVTYAFNHKYSGAIIPYFIDDSLTMPPGLEIMLGSINWRRMESCPFDSQLIEEIRKAMENPETGTVAGRKVASPARRRIVNWTTALGLILLTAVVGFFAARDNRNRKLEQAALEDSRLYERMITSSDSLVAISDRLGLSAMSLETTGEQIDGLKRAYSLLDSAADVRNRYSDTQYKGLFGKDMSEQRRAVRSRMDSIHDSWTHYAIESYNLYIITKKQSERDNVLSCIDFALSLKPNNELETIKNKLDL